MRSEYRYLDTRLRYRHDFLEGGPFHAALGASLAYQDLRVKLWNDTKSEQVRDTRWLPLLHAHLSLDFLKHWNVGVETDWIEFSGESQLDLGAYLNYNAGSGWDISAGYRYYTRGSNRT